MFLTPLQEIAFSHVEEFCQTWAEGVRVEYKRDLTQIPKIISSFANTFGGIWVIGVETDRRTNMPILPIQGIPEKVGLEEQITQACWLGMHPPVTPTIRVLPVPTNPGRIVVVVKVSESIDAPHAIENTTRVYIRTNSNTEPIELADIDRIDYLLKRRREPEERREQMLAAAAKRSGIEAPCIRVMIGPKFPHRPLLIAETLARQLDEGRAWQWRRVQQGFISVAPSSTIRERVEVNLHGWISYARVLGDAPQTSGATPEDDRSSRIIHPHAIIQSIARVLNMAALLLRDTTVTLLTRVRLEGVKGYFIGFSPLPWGDGFLALEDTIAAESDIFREILDEQFSSHIQGLVREVMWAFDLADERTINDWTAEILKVHWPKRVR